MSSAGPAVPGWRLSQVLIGLVYAASLLTFGLVSGAVLLWHLPALERDHEAQVQRQARDFLRREELLLHALQTQVGITAQAVTQLAPAGLNPLLDAAVDDGSLLRAVAVISTDGLVQAVGLPPARRAQRAELLGQDLTGQHSVRLARERPGLRWGAMGALVLSGDQGLPLVLRLGDGRVVLAEVANATLLARTLGAPGQRQQPGEPRLWVVDSNGEVMADSDGDRAVGQLNLLNTPGWDAATEGISNFRVTLDGTPYLAAATGSATLHWRFVASLPAGLAHPEVRSAVLLELGGVAGALLLGLALAPLVSRRLVGWLQSVLRHAEEAALHRHPPPWSPTPVREFNQLADRLTGLTGELRELNAGLEQRVAQRTEALAGANEALQHLLDSLQQTRDELLRAEKQAALGDLVAGVAHELNTPIGNTLMAVSTLGEELREFRSQMAAGLRRADLERLLEGAEQATAISSRNLRRAADLVTSFKQVAVDRTTAQRRHFRLAEVVDEIVLTLKPSFQRSPIRIEQAVDATLSLDSYPGALGQILTNLINNALVHAFDGREQGRILISARGLPDDRLELVVADDGVGIAPHLIGRVFDPFVTTRMGRGGTGLGLHIAHNAASHILGGTLEVHSAAGEGSRFVLRLPRTAPMPPPDAPAPA